MSHTHPNHGPINSCPEEEAAHHCSGKYFIIYGAQKDLILINPCCLDVALIVL